MLVVKAGSIGVDEVGLCKNLQSHALRNVRSPAHIQTIGHPYLGADVVEVQLVARRPTDVDTAGEADLLGLICLAILEVGEGVLELGDVVCNVELYSHVSPTPSKL